MQLQVHELKAVAVMANLVESEKSITRDQCIAVGHLDYQCVRRRDGKGHTYGSSDPSMLTFTMRINHAEQAQLFYEQLTVNEHDPLSFIFNATFADNQQLSGYDDAMVVEGYVVEVEELFHSAAMTEGEEEQILLRVRMQVHSITYIGRDDNKTLYFVQ